MIFGFLRQNLKTQCPGAAGGVAWTGGGGEQEPDDGRTRACEGLGSFRGELHGCFTARGDELFELADAVLCAEGPVRTLVGLSLAPEHRRGHGALYDAVNAGRVDVARLRWSLACLPLPRWPDSRIRLAVDVSNWLRPGAATSPERMFCHVYAPGKGQGQMIPCWPHSAVLPPGGARGGGGGAQPGRGGGPGGRGGDPGRGPGAPGPPRPPGTAPRWPVPGTGCTPGSPAAAPGRTTTVSCRSSRAP